jgi:hypothetical protein
MSQQLSPSNLENTQLYDHLNLYEYCFYKSQIQNKPHAAERITRILSEANKRVMILQDEWKQKHLNRLTKSDTTRATAASGEKPVRGIRPTKARSGISKG